MFTHLSDADLIELVKKDNTTAFEELYNRHVVSLLNAAYQKLQSEEEAKDIVQDVFFQFLLRKDKLQHTDNIAGYLHTTLKHKILDCLRKKKLRQEKHHINAVTHFFEETNNTFPTPEEFIITKELTFQINTILEEMPSRSKEAFSLSREQDMPYKEIAKHMNISIKTVEKHISKALHYFVQRLK